MILTLITAGAFALLPAETQGALERCGVDAAEMQRLLDLEQQAFDQDMGGGWRAVSYQNGCKNAAGELIEAYMLYSRPQPERMAVLRWHAGQMKAEAGETDEALALFRAAYRDQAPDAEADWNSYVDATIAFLEGDRAALEAARARLAAQPEPSADDVAAMKAFAEKNNINWTGGAAAKPNLSAADNLLACFGQPYAIAYICERNEETP